MVNSDASKYYWADRADGFLMGYHEPEDDIASDHTVLPEHVIDLPRILNARLGDDHSVEIISLEAGKIMKTEWLVIVYVEADFCN